MYNLEKCVMEHLPQHSCSCVPYTLVRPLQEWAASIQVCCTHEVLVAPHGVLEEAEGGLRCSGGRHVPDELRHVLMDVLLLLEERLEVL